MIKAYTKPLHPHNYLIDHFNFISFLTYAAAAGQPIKIYTRTRHYIGNYKAIDHENPPIIVNHFNIYGSLIYYKVGQYNTNNIGYDEIIKIELCQEVKTA